MENDQMFDDEAMLELALAMSLQSPASMSPRSEGHPPGAASALLGEPDAASTAEEATTAEDVPLPSAAEVVVAAVPIQDVEAAAVAKAAGPESPQKKKKKKDTYASMMATVMAPSVSDEEKKRELDVKLKSTLGGGQFSKLDKI